MSTPLSPARFGHAATLPAHELNEKKTQRVIAITVLVMVLEIGVGYTSGSLALLADGWHMASDAGALALAWFAYRYAKSQAARDKLSFGTGKVHALSAWTSAVLLGVIGLEMVYEGIHRIVAPQSIAFREALVVAILGLVVNLVSAWILRDQPHTHAGHAHTHASSCDHDPHDHDHVAALTVDDPNLRAAYLHLLADALTSLLAIVALIFGALYGWTWLDAVSGVVGAAVLLKWSFGLLRQTSGLLLDATPDTEDVEKLRTAIEDSGPYKVLDLHVWDLAPGHRACIVAVCTDRSQDTPSICQTIHAMGKFEHVTIHIEAPCTP